MELEPAAPVTPQKACLDEIANSDVVVLLLGACYGDLQESGSSGASRGVVGMPIELARYRPLVSRV